MSGVANWLTATGSARAAICGASLTRGSGPTRMTRSPQTTGAIAHLVLESWLRANGWNSGHPRVAFAEALASVEETTGRRLAGMSGGAKIQLQLQQKVAGLTVLLQELGTTAGEIDVEEPLVDERRHFWGIPDVLVRASGWLIIDLKTGRSTDSSLATARAQLLLYAHLVSTMHGRLPSELAVLSTVGGLQRVEFRPADVAAHVSMLAELRNTKEPDARPDSEVCRFCPKRFECEPHWNALPTWTGADAVQGRVITSERSRNGRLAITFVEDDSEQTALVWDIDGATVRTRPGAGSRVAFIRLSPSAATERSWRWSQYSAVRLR